MSITHKTRRFICPTLPPTILYREKLVRRLREAIAGPKEGFPHHKLILLYTPAGYGKTTLLADFARHIDIPCCWYFLDRTDTEKFTFLKHLLTSIRHCFPQFGLSLDALLTSAIAADREDPEKHRCEAVIDTLVAEIEAENLARFTLMLCNYQEVNDCVEVNKLVNYLLYKLPPQCVLVIESRAMPDLEFASLLARREMIGLGTQFLCFSTQELCDLVQLQGTVAINAIEAEQIVIAFQGWITGILLGTHLGNIQFLRNKSHHSSDSQDFQMERYYLFSYMVNEVFSKRNPETYAFLKDMSVLQEMTPMLCAQLLDITDTDAAERLEYLEQNGFFVTHSGEGRQIVYTCHPVLRELLYDELRQQSPTHFTHLHRQAAELLSAQLDYEKAVYHAIEAKAYDIVLHVILNAYEHMLTQGHVETLARWIDELHKQNSAITLHPRLLLMRANIYLLVGDYMHGLNLLNQMPLLIQQQSSAIDSDEMPLLHIETTVLRSKALFQQGEYSQAQELCQQALDTLPVDEVRLRAEVHTRLGVCANMLGQMTTGVIQLQKALQLWGRHTTGRQAAEIHSALASTYSLLSNFALAEHHIARAIICWEQLHDEWGKINNMIRLGLIKQRQGLFYDAEEAFTQALTRARGTIHFSRGQAYALVNIGTLYQDQELFEKSLTAIEDGLALARQVQDRYLTNYALCMLAMTYLYMNDTSTAQMLLSEVDIQQGKGKQPGYEQMLYELVYGTILLYQHRYEDAFLVLSKLETLLNTTGLRHEQLQTTLRIAACLFEQGQREECIHRLEAIVAQLKIENGHEQQVAIEIQRLPHLSQVMAILPNIASERARIHLVTAQPEKQPEAQPVSTPDSTPSTTKGVSSISSAQVIINHPKIAIQALGEPVVTLQELPITRWRMARSMELFFFLLDARRPMRKEQIITALWSEVDESINQTFHSTIYYLRKALEIPCVISQGSTYTLDLTSHFGKSMWYDVAAFQEQQTRAKEALHQENDIELKDALLSMVKFYRGDYVQPFYSDWCTFRRDELRRAYLDAHRQLGHMAWRLEQFDESVTHWQHILAIDNCLEDAHYGLMRCYLRQGKRGLALRQYQRCRDTLQQELGVQPGNTIQNLYQRLAGTA